MKLPIVSSATICRVVAVLATVGSLFTGLAQTGSESVNKPGETNQVVTFDLKPTAIAPVGAKGSVRIMPGSLAIHLSQMGPGTYHIEVVGRADAIRKKLGTITIVDPTDSPSRQATDNKKEASAHPESVMVETEASVSIPSGIKPLKISRVLVVGAGGNAVLDSKPQ